MLSKIINWFFTKKQESYKILDVEIPPEIKYIGKLYPILHTLAGNRACGEIRKFKFVRENKLHVGQAFIIRDKYDVVSTWIHLGNDFFKLVIKA